MVTVFSGCPGELEIVGDDAGAFLELLFEDGGHLLVGGRKKVDGQQVGGAVILFEEVAVDDAGGLVQAQFVDLLGALLVQILIHLDAGGVGVEFLRRHDYDTAVAAAEVEHLFAGFEFAQLQHFGDDGFGRRVIGRQLFDIGFLGRENSRDSE